MKLSKEASNVLKGILSRCRIASKCEHSVKGRDLRFEIRSGRHKSIFIDHTYLVQQARRDWMIAGADRKTAEELSVKLADRIRENPLAKPPPTG